MLLQLLRLIGGNVTWLVSADWTLVTRQIGHCAAKMQHDVACTAHAIMAQHSEFNLKGLWKDHG